MQRPRPAGPEASFKDRCGRLRFLGVLLLLIGSGCFLLAGVMAFAIILSPGLAPGSPPVDSRSIPAILVLLGGLGAMFVACGIGSLRARRWVRPVILIVGWTWLLFGLMSAVLAFFTMDLLLGDAEGIPDAEAFAVKLVALGLLAVVHILMPGVLVWGYRSQDVRKTCEARNPEPSWTDRCPLPVLTWSLMLAVAAVLWLPFVLSTPFPLFGRVVSGRAASFLQLTVLCAFGYLSWATYRLDRLGWWGSVAVTLAVGASSAVTLLRMDLPNLLRAIGAPEEQVGLLRQGGLPGRMSLVLWTCAITATTLIYLLRLRKHFGRARF